MSIIKINKSGFSIAEALVTMLIVALIIMITLPIITKRGVKGSGTSGGWECRFNPVTGKHESITIKTPQNVDPSAPPESYGKVSDDGSSCIFTPPKSARNFTVNVIGGGGGGAAASTEADELNADLGGSTFVPKYTGMYNILVIGGGGSGGCTNCGHGPAQDGALGGGAGGVNFQKDYTLQKGKTYSLQVGSGGVIDNIDQYRADGVKGGDSYIKNQEGATLIQATGGTGGFGGEHGGFMSFDGTMCQPRSGWQNRGISGTPHIGPALNMQDAIKNKSDPRGVNTTTPGYICTSSDTCINNEIKEALGQFAGSGIGAGGSGGPKNQSCGQPGQRGLIRITYSGLYAGGGGHAGTHIYKIFKKLPAEIVVKIGKGGVGGSINNSDGKPGENSAFGNLAVAGGGSGGRVKEVIGPSKPKGYLEGAPGGESPLGGFYPGGLMNGNTLLDGLKTNTSDPNLMYPGAGGGGGASKDKKNCSASNEYEGCWGKGGRGEIGLVRVEWN